MIQSSAIIPFTTSSPSLSVIPDASSTPISQAVALTKLMPTHLHAFLERSEFFRTHPLADVCIVGSDTFSIG